MLEIKQIKSSELAEFSLPLTYEVIIVLPFIDETLARKASVVMQRRTKQEGLLLLVEDNLRLGFIMVCNLVFVKTSSKFFAYTAQDAFPGEGWLDCGLDTIKKTESGLLAFNDGRFFGSLAVFGLVYREWVKTLYKKFLFYPEYKSHYADTELSAIALETGKLVYNPHALLIEVDYEKHLHGNNLEDHKLYFKRAETGFGGIIKPFTPVSPK